MGLYTYICPNCGKITLEKKMSEPEFKICPVCNGKLQRVWKPITDIWKCGGNYGRNKSL